MKFAQRKSIGPYASSEPDAAQRERALAAMVRAGHGFALARTIIGLKPGEIPDFESLFNVR
jgi:regulatory protein